MSPKRGGKKYACGKCKITYHHTELWQSPNHLAFPPEYNEDGSCKKLFVCVRCQAFADIGDDKEKLDAWKTEVGRDGCGNSQPTLGGTLPGAAKYVIMLQRFVKASCKAP